MHRNDSYSENSNQNNTEQSKRIQRRWIISISIIIFTIFAIILALLSIFVILEPAKPKTTVTTTIRITTTRQRASKL
jgi:uncharacterized membrane protein